MPVKRSMSDAALTSSPIKRFRNSSSPQSNASTSLPADMDHNEYGPAWADWPAPRDAMRQAREFVLDIVEHKRSVLIVPDKDADGLSAGSLMHRTLLHLNHPPNLIKVHHLTKGTNVFSDYEQDRMTATGAEKVIVLDQGSRPGRSLVPPLDNASGKRVLIIDHHMSDEWPEGSQVLTACNTHPIATAALLTYVLLRDLHPKVREEDDWRAVVGAVGDLGSAALKWGKAPWPSELGATVKRYGTKTIGEAVSCINAPRRTAEYNVPKAWDIMVQASGPGQIASNAFLKLCKLDATAETERWARTAPRFSLDGRVAVITVHTGFQVHPVIATRWAGTLSRKSPKLIMVMCANTGFHPDDRVSFSCRIASSLRSLPDESRPNLIAMLNQYGDQIPGFHARVGGDFARGHKEATGGIIAKAEFALLLDAIGVSTSGSSKKDTSSPGKGRSKKVIDPSQTIGIKDFFKPR